MDPNAPSYIERDADAQLLAALIAGEYVFLLDSRQKGKSSMVARTIVKLREQGIATVKLDLQRIGANVTPEQWYAGMLNGIGQELNLTDALFEYWEAHTAIGPLARWIGALQEVVLAKVSDKLIIFVDEIDFVRALPFSTDEFFAAIRDCYNRRSDVKGFERLTFCLVGVATPGQLIRNPEITPFNIGARIDLTDFTLRETEAYATALDAEGRSGKTLMERVHYWVSGHPYLTQLLCGHIAADKSISSVPAVDRMVKQLFFSPEARQREPNFSDVERRMLDPDVPGMSAEERRSQVLDLYGRLLRSKGVAVSEENPVVASLRLAGVGHEERGRLRLRNRTYARVFDEGWRRQSLPGGELRRQRGAARLATLRTAAVAGLILVVLSTAAVGLWNLSRERKELIAQLQRKAVELERQNYAEKISAIRYSVEARRWPQAQEMIKKTKSDRFRGWEWGHVAKYFECEMEAEMLQGTLVETDPDGIPQIVNYEGIYDLATNEPKLRSRFPSLASGTLARLAKSGVGFERTYGRRIGEMRIWLDNAGSASIYDANTDELLVPGAPGKRIYALSPHWKSYLLWKEKANNNIELRSARDNRLLSIIRSPLECIAADIAKDKSIIGICRAEVSGSRNELRRWNSLGKTLAIAQTQITGKRVINLKMAPDNLHFVVYSFQSWEVRRLADLSVVASASGLTDPQQEVAFSRDSKLFAVGSGEEGSIRVYETKSGKLVRTLVGLGPTASLAFYPDNKQLAAADWAGNIRVWSLEKPGAVDTFRDEQVYVALLSSDGVNLVTKTLAGTISSRNLRTNRVVHRKVVESEGIPSLLSVGQDSVFLGFSDGTIARLEANGLTEETRTAVFKGNQPHARKLGDGNLLFIYFIEPAVDPRDDNCAVIDTHTMQVLCRFRYEEMPPVESRAFVVDSTKDGALIAMLHMGGKYVSLYSSVNGKLIRRWTTNDRFQGLAISPNGTEIAVSVIRGASKTDGCINVYDTRKGSRIVQIDTPGDYPGNLTYSPTLRQLAGAMGEGACLWDIATGKRIAELKSGSLINRTHFSPDGDRVITSGFENSTTLWDATNGSEVGSLRYSPLEFTAQSNVYETSTFSRDGRDLVMVCPDGAVRIWHSLPWK